MATSGSGLMPLNPLSMDGNNAQISMWKQKFELYMLASESNKKLSEVHVAIELHAIGTYTLEVYNMIEKLQQTIRKMLK